MLAQSDMEALVVFARHRDIFLSLPGGFGDQLDAALQDLELEQAYEICKQATEAVAR